MLAQPDPGDEVVALSSAGYAHSPALNRRKKWRRGQDSNLHNLSVGGFQDRCTTIMRPLRIVASMNITQAAVDSKLSAVSHSRHGFIVHATKL